MKCQYAQNKLNAAYVNEQPTMTDQAGADETNINVIVKQFRITGRATGHTSEPLDMDFALLPSDLRTMIETTREIQHMRNSLPRELRDIHPDELMTLTNEQLARILTPPAQTPAQTETTT